MSLGAVIAAVVVFGVAHIVARYRGAPVLAGVLKPLPVALLALAVWQAAPPGAFYGPVLVAGLLFGMVGDICLVFPAGFVMGLASFLVGHLFYVVAFSSGGSWGAQTLLLLVPIVLVAALMLRFLWPHLGRMRGAVMVYVLVIAVMVWRAAVRAVAPATPPASGALALAGAGLFMVSDAVLATDRFARPFSAANAVVMVTYYAGQALIAASAL
jgi:uncharacterized membrane protein YhhN